MGVFGPGIIHCIAHKDPSIIMKLSAAVVCNVAGLFNVSHNTQTTSV